MAYDTTAAALQEKDLTSIANRPFHIMPRSYKAPLRSSNASLVSIHTIVEQIVKTRPRNPDFKAALILEAWHRCRPYNHAQMHHSVVKGKTLYLRLPSPPPHDQAQPLLAALQRAIIGMGGNLNWVERLVFLPPTVAHKKPPF